MPHPRLSILALSVLAVACGKEADTAGETSACGLETEDFSAGMSKDGDWGELVFTVVSADPAPPDKGDNTWNLEITQADGTARDDLTVTVAPFMPEHGHGSTPPEFDVFAQGSSGAYTTATFDLFMGGVWDIVLQATATDVDDSSTFRLCVEG